MPEIRAHKKHKTIKHLLNKSLYTFCLKYFSFIANLKDNYFRRIGNWKHGKAPKIYIQELFPAIKTCQVNLINTFDYLVDMSVDPLELLHLVSIVKISNPKNIFEVGTYDGKTTLNLAANTPENCTIYTLDLPPDWDGHFTVKIPKTRKNSIQLSDNKIMQHRYKDFECKNKIKQIYCDSAIFDWQSLNIKFDIIFIDGCHYKDYVKIDSDNAYNNLSEKGIIIWHDYAMMNDVSEVVDSFSDKLNIYTIHGTRLAIGIKK